MRFAIRWRPDRFVLAFGGYSLGFMRAHLPNDPNSSWGVLAFCLVGALFFGAAFLDIRRVR
jgi:hypothetical protein